MTIIEQMSNLFCMQVVLVRFTLARQWWYMLLEREAMSHKTKKKKERNLFK